MQLLDHLSITVRNLSQVRPFYVAVISALDAKLAYDQPDAIGFGQRNRPHDDRHTYLCAGASGGNKIEAVFHHGTADA